MDEYLLKTIELVKNDSWMMEILELVEKLDLPDCYIGAGFLRNKIWDYLHGYRERTKLNDIDIVYYDKEILDDRYENIIESQLFAISKFNIWSVTNQARMHIINGHEPYKNTEHAISYWPELPTCVGIKILNGNLDILAPFGLENNFSLRVESNPINKVSKEIMLKRVNEKGWIRKWPKLKIENS